MNHSSDYTFFGGGGFGGINKPASTFKSIIVPVPTVPSSAPTESKVKKVTRKRNQISTLTKRKQISNLKRKQVKKPTKKNKKVKTTKKVRFANF
jgi:hypothetical protein